ncbi:MAG: hypothetical protein L6R42_004809 [Xanthoria sp. 1 TBL-2021]|nr:MAG: hypothetical protein L6R42_004809 [Xanthoria sp. 1 TBL-2021]
MADNYRIFLAQQVLSEGLIASRPLLFQFHKQQNSKKPGSVHAVYLVTGYIIPVTPTSSAQYEQADGEDAHMQSSPFMSSSMPQQEEEEERLAVKTVTLCREEELEAAKHASEDPLQAGRQYGTIQNARVKRRTGPRPIPAQSTPTASKGTLAPKASTPAVKAETKPNPARETKALPAKTASRSEAKPKDETPQQSSQQKRSAAKTPGLRREQSDIFKSFAKPANKVSRENTGSSVGASPAPKAVRFFPNNRSIVKLLTIVSYRKLQLPKKSKMLHKMVRRTQRTKQTFISLLVNPESMDEASDGEQLEDSIISAEKAAKSKRGTRSEREDQLKKLLDDDGRTTKQFTPQKPTTPPKNKSPLPSKLPRRLANKNP